MAVAETEQTERAKRAAAEAPPVLPTDTWAVRVPRPWITAYGWADDERAATLLAELRKAQGFETTADFSEAVFERTQDRFGQYGVDLPPPLLDAIEFPCVNWLEYVVELAQAHGVSPGTLLDHLLLRSANCLDEDGTEDES